jgi:hypothetical protein
MQTRGRRPLPSQPPLRSNSNAGNVIYRKPSVVRSRDGSPVGTIRQGTRTTVDYRKINTLKQKTKKPITAKTKKQKRMITGQRLVEGSATIGPLIKSKEGFDSFVTGRVSGELNVVSNQHMVNKKLVNKDGKLNPTLQGWESRNLTSGRTKRQLNQGATFGMPIFYRPSVFDRV